MRLEYISMGGHGSGQYQSYEAKGRVEHCHQLRISKLYRAGLRWDRTFQGTVTYGSGSKLGFAAIDNILILQYVITNGKYAQRSMRYGIQIECTTPHYGGRRLWFLCPLCQRRSGVLYLPMDQPYFCCRACADLTYASTREPNFKKELARLLAREARLTAQMAKYGIAWPAKSKTELEANLLKK